METHKDNKIPEIENVRLSDEEKAAARARVIAFMEYHRVRNAADDRHISQRSGIINPFFSFMFKPIPIVALAIVLLLGGVSGVAASTLPGDTLYPVKLASESVITAFIFSPEKKAERNTALAERRLKEAETLIARGDFTPPIAAAVESKIAEMSAKVAENINLLKEQNKLDKAITISSAFEIALGAHEEVLGKIAATAPQKAAAEGAATETFVAPLVQSIQEHKDAAAKIRTDIESLPAVQAEPTLTKLIEDLNANRATRGETKVKEVEDSFPTPLPMPISRDVYIEKISPSAGMVGAEVTLSGYGFIRYYVRAPDAETGETYVNFGGGYVKASGTGSTLTFTIPEGITPRCVFVEDKIQPRCTAPSRKTIPGEYAVSVVTPWGTSNTVTFKVVEFMLPNPEPTPVPTTEGTTLKQLTREDISKEQQRLKGLNDDDYIYYHPKDLNTPPQVLGTYNGRVVETLFFCFGDVCPANGGYFLRYKNVTSREECNRIGGKPIIGLGWGEVYGGCGIK